MNNGPIGIFDSGVGGLSIYMELKKMLPKESFVYVADTKNCPYGSRKKDEIILLSERITDFLIEKKCKIIVVACNTATTAAIGVLRKKFSTPFVGVEPAVKKACSETKTGVVGILATKGTLESDSFKDLCKKYAGEVSLIEKEANELVWLIESSCSDTKRVSEKIKKYIEPMMEKGADKVVLGCTHYPLVKDIMINIYGNNIDFIDSSNAVAKQTKKVLNDLDAFSEKEISSTAFYSTGDASSMKDILNALGIYNAKIETVGI